MSQSWHLTSPRMKTFEDIPGPDEKRILLWGPSGNGKTALAGQWPGILMADTDNLGLEVWRSKWFQAWNNGPPDLIGWDSFDDERDEHGLYVKAEGMWKMIEFINKHADDDGVKTLVMDSLSSTQDLCMNVGYEISARDKKSLTYAKVKDLATGRVKPPDPRKPFQHPVMSPTQADFGSEMSAFSQLLDGFLGIPGKTKICIAHERIDYTDSGAIRSKSPLFTGQAIRARIGKWFSEVWYLDVNNKGERVLITQPDGLIATVKTRSGLPAQIVEPTYAKIMEAMR